MAVDLWWERVDSGGAEQEKREDGEKEAEDDEGAVEEAKGEGWRR